MNSSSWYFTSLVIGAPAEAPFLCHCLVVALNHDNAYEKSIQLGAEFASGHRLQECGRGAHPFVFHGVHDLLLIHEEVEDGAEILWCEEELTTKELHQRIKKQAMLRAYSKVSSQRTCGWYVGSIVLHEVHDTGSHDSKQLTWTNSYLFTASSPDAAYKKIMRIGRLHQTQMSSHSCNGHKAHWEFLGVKELLPACDPPSDGSLLWCDDLKTRNPHRLIHRKGDLSVFQWQAEQDQTNGGG